MYRCKVAPDATSDVPSVSLSVENQKAWYHKRNEIAHYLYYFHQKEPTETEIDNNMLSIMNIQVKGACKWKHTISVANPYAILELSKYRNPSTNTVMFLQEQARCIPIADWNTIFRS